MGGPCTLDAFAPVDNPLAERIAAIAARTGRDAADLAVLYHELPIPADAREAVERECVGTITATMESLGQFKFGDSERFHQIALVAFDRRLAYHATQTEGRA